MATRSPVTYRLDDGVSTIALDDGKVNALSPTMLSELSAALDRAVADKAVTVLTGRQGVFSAGFDLKVLSAGGTEARQLIGMGFDIAKRLLTFPTPVVIGCSGHALAMGAFLVLSADFRIGADGAYKIGANEVAIGLTMPRAAIEICRHRLAPAHFQRAVVNAEIYAPGDAVSAGFLDHVVPARDVDSATRAAANRLLKLDMAAHAATKLRAREQMLIALRAAIEADAAEFAARTYQ